MKHSDSLFLKISEGSLKIQTYPRKILAGQYTRNLSINVLRGRTLFKKSTPIHTRNRIQIKIVYWLNYFFLDALQIKRKITKYVVNDNNYHVKNAIIFNL